MAQDQDYIKSMGLWIEEQKTLIETIKANREYVLKDIDIKQRTLNILEESILHEEYQLKKEIENLENYKTEV